MARLLDDLSEPDWPVDPTVKAALDSTAATWVPFRNAAVDKLTRGEALTADEAMAVYRPTKSFNDAVKAKTNNGQGQAAAATGANRGNRGNGRILRRGR